jgi:hypothetical protein
MEERLAIQADHLRQKMLGRPRAYFETPLLNSAADRDAAEREERFVNIATAFAANGVLCRGHQCW